MLLLTTRNLLQTHKVFKKPQLFCGIFLITFLVSIVGYIKHYGLLHVLESVKHFKNMVDYPTSCIQYYWVRVF